LIAKIIDYKHIIKILQKHLFVKIFVRSYFGFVF